MKKKWWIGFGDCPIFGKKDTPIFIVVPTDGNREQRLTWTKYVEADDMAASRAALHAEVDKYFDHMEHMGHLELIAEKQKGPPPPPVVEDGGSLRIL